MSRLAPHESPNTDVVLLGHSMGGLLSADVVLLPSYSPATGQAFRHRMLGTVNFDVPFLGLHPGVIGSGIASLFRPAEQQSEAQGNTGSQPPLTSPTSITLDSNVEDTSSSSSGRKRHDTLYSQPEDPNFNPAYFNDVNLKVRKGWKNFAHFVNKHSDSLRQATTQYVKSHIEFGSAMADYPSLRARYSKIRALEDEDELVRRTALARPARSVPRVRFVNYYTASTGRPKRDKSPSPRRIVDGTLEPPDVDAKRRSASTSPSDSRSSSRSPRISIEEQRDDGEVVVKEVIDPVISPSTSEEEAKSTSKQEDKEGESSPAETDITLVTTLSNAPSMLTKDSTYLPSNLPPLPDEPIEPPQLDLSSYPDKDVQKVVQRQHDRRLKAYKQAIKDRNDAIRDRGKLIEKLRKAAAKEEGKKLKTDEQSLVQPPLSTDPIASSTDGAADDSTAISNTEAKETQARGTVLHPSALDRTSTLSRQSSAVPSSLMSPTTADSHSRLTSLTSLDLTPTSSGTREVEPPPAKQSKDRKFCALAKAANGEVDECWVRVPMPGLDEVGAHCGLFTCGDGDHYDRLVGDVGEKIEEWVRQYRMEDWGEEALD